ncbi:MAG: DUF6362 family protein [Isosphaeraceae bacterium]
MQQDLDGDLGAEELVVRGAADTLTAQEVFDQVARAVRTLRKLPPVAVRSRFCNWPPIVRSFHESYGYAEATMPRLVPTARQLSDLDAVIRWIAWLSRYGEEYPRIVWARAENRSWRHIATVAGLPKSTCEWRFREAIYALTMALAKGDVK